MAATIVTVLLNAVLDPIFIFTLDMGIQGAAIATVLAQLCSLIWILKIFSNKKEVVHFDRGVFKLEPRIVKESFAIGLAPFLMNFVACFIVIAINKSLKIYGGDLSIGAYGIVNRIVFVFIMVVMGLTQGMQPIVGYNYGARQMDRVFETLKKTILYATVVMTFGFAVCMLFPRTVVSIFTTDAELLQKSADGLSLIVAMFPLVASSIVIGNFFQSIGKPKRSIFLSLSRQLLFLLPCLWILPEFYDIDGVWYSFIVSDFMATCVAYMILYLFIKKYRKTNEI
jgi:Na+-driven multidrug efflux pump